MAQDEEGGSDGGSDGMYFATKISATGNYKLLFELARNQLLLLASCVWTLSVIDPTTDPTFFALTEFDTSVSSLALGAVLAAPLVAGGYVISRSESRLWTDINAGTQQLALRLFGGTQFRTRTSASAHTCTRTHDAHPPTCPRAHPLTCPRARPLTCPREPARTQARRHSSQWQSHHHCLQSSPASRKSSAFVVLVCPSRQTGVAEGGAWDDMYT